MLKFGFTEDEYIASERKERRLKFIEEHKEEWIREGKMFRDIREFLRMTRREIRGMIGASEDTIAKFEAGKPIMRRQLVANAYLMALNSEVLQRENKIKSLRSEWFDPEDGYNTTGGNRPLGSLS